jgi:hypothetical protein
VPNRDPVPGYRRRPGLPSLVNAATRISRKDSHMSGVEPRVRVAYFVPPSENIAGIERVVHEKATGLTEAYGDVLDVHVLFASD